MSFPCLLGKGIRNVQGLVTEGGPKHGSTAVWLRLQDKRERRELERNTDPEANGWTIGRLLKGKAGEGRVEGKGSAGVRRLRSFFSPDGPP
jgi:hypothetical protein